MAEQSLEEGDVASAWNRNAERWTHDVRAGLDLFRERYTLPAFLAFMPKIDARRVIDLGCGEGANTRLFAGLGGHLTGIDISPAMIARARDEEGREPLGIRYEVASYSRLDGIASETFDCALSTMALMDGPDFASAMREAYRVLVRGGTLCFSILHPCFITPALEWLYAEDGSCTGVRVGQYFSRTPFVEYWRFSGRAQSSTVDSFEVPQFPRTLSDYINAVCDAGFRFAKIAEPKPDDAACREHARLAKHKHAPLVLFVMAVKP